MSESDSTADVEYRAIPGFPGYRVGDDGSVWTCKNARWGFRDEWRRMKGTIACQTGYPVVSMPDADGKRRPKAVHSLVLLAFVGPRPKGMECRHLNGIKTDNRLANLAWGTKSQNSLDRNRLGESKLGEDHPGAKLTTYLVCEARQRARAGEIVKDLAAEHGVNYGVLLAAVVGRTWKSLNQTEEPVDVGRNRFIARGKRPDRTPLNNASDALLALF